MVGDTQRPERHDRALPFRRNEKLEDLLSQLRGPLSRAENELLEQISPERKPVVLIVGCARAGSTLMLQFLANSGAFGYPSNFLSRFFSGPVMGAYIQRMLFDREYQFRNELRLDGIDQLAYTSDLGKTEGAMAPNEFMYFWRRWIEESDGHPPGMQHIDRVNFGAIDRELVGLATAFGRPFALKAHILNWMLPAVLENIPDSYVLFVRRDPIFTAQSLLEARVRFFGSDQEWYSFKPAEYEWLRHLPPPTQVAGQVHFTELAIENGLRGVDQSRVVEAHYEELSSDPGTVWARLADKLERHRNCGDLGPCPATPAFVSANERRLPIETFETIGRALADFSS